MIGGCWGTSKEASVTVRGRRRALRGTTLVEMLVIVAILGVIAALAVPNIAPMLASAKQHTEVEQLASFIDAARRQAINEGRCFRIRQIGSTLAVERRESGDCVSINRDSWSSPLLRLSPSETFVYTLAGQSLTTPASVLADDHRIVFRPSGRLYGDGDLDVADDGARVVVQSTQSGVKRAVVVTALGRVCAVNYGATNPGVVASAMVCP